MELLPGRTKGDRSSNITTNHKDATANSAICYRKSDMIRNVSFHWLTLSFTWLKAHAICAKKYTLTGEHVSTAKPRKTIEILFKANRRFNHSGPSTWRRNDI